MERGRRRMTSMVGQSRGVDVFSNYIRQAALAWIELPAAPVPAFIWVTPYCAIVARIGESSTVNKPQWNEYTRATPIEEKRNKKGRQKNKKQ